MPIEPTSSHKPQEASAGRRFAGRAVVALLLAAAVGVSGWLMMGSSSAFTGRDLAALNIAVPAVTAGWRAHRRGTAVGPAILQALAGGLCMQKAMETAAKVRDDDPWRAWRAKFLMNVGASLAESAPEGRFLYRMDFGPVWLEAGPGGFRFKPGLHGSLAPLLNLADGARIDPGRSLRLGTLAYERNRNRDGTIGRNGALAYSNANNLVTNRNGDHAGHELIHTFQYRRDVSIWPSLGQLFPAIRCRTDRWVDDTGWSVAWGSQCAASRIAGQDRDFDILMEREAYELTDTYRNFR
ncbi:MAG TPA: hypothetical protein PLU72_04700 [Candidatus Ozemobacteraceae bacterium]|nr:hypothetical protein [Candidatus Ozemobacteraceae bacterium]